MGAGGSSHPPAISLEGDSEVQTNSLRPTDRLQDSKHGQIRPGRRGQPVEGQGQAASFVEPRGRGYQGLRGTKWGGGKLVSEGGLGTEIHCRIRGHPALMPGGGAQPVSSAPHPQDANAEGRELKGSVPSGADGS